MLSPEIKEYSGPLLQEPDACPRRLGLEPGGREWRGRGNSRGRQGSHAPGCTAVGIPGWEKRPQGQHGQQARSNTAGAHQQGGLASSQASSHPSRDGNHCCETQGPAWVWQGWALWLGVWKEAGPWAVWRREIIQVQRGLKATCGNGKVGIRGQGRSSLPSAPGPGQALSLYFQRELRALGTSQALAQGQLTTGKILWKVPTRGQQWDQSLRGWWRRTALETEAAVRAGGPGRALQVGTEPTVPRQSPRK